MPNEPVPGALALGATAELAQPCLRLARLNKLSPGTQVPTHLRLTFALIVVTALPRFALAQSPASTPPKRPTEMYVPASDLDAVLGMEKRGVLLPRSQFEELLRRPNKTPARLLTSPTASPS
jgi:hypothetical protein